MTLSADDLDRLERLAKARIAAGERWKAALAGSTDEEYAEASFQLDEADASWSLAVRSPDVTLALVAEIREGRRAREWQPIETAPKDGSGIVAYDPGGTFPNGRSNPPFVGIAAWSEGDDLNEPHWSGPGTPKGHPTHWFKVPSAPATEPR